MALDQSKKIGLQEKNGTDLVSNAFKHLEDIIDRHLKPFQSMWENIIKGKLKTIQIKKPEAMINTRKKQKAVEERKQQYLHRHNNTNTEYLTKKISNITILGGLWENIGDGN